MRVVADVPGRFRGNVVAAADNPGQVHAERLAHPILYIKLHPTIKGQPGGHCGHQGEDQNSCFNRTQAPS